MNLLAEDVTFWGDGGGKVKGAATRPVTGRVAVARFFLETQNVFRRSLPKDAQPELTEVNRQPALVIRSGERALCCTDNRSGSRAHSDYSCCGQPG